jgi:hypothetical protein
MADGPEVAEPIVHNALSVDIGGMSKRKIQRRRIGEPCPESE